MILDKILEFLAQNDTTPSLETIIGIIATALGAIIAALIPLVKSGLLKLILELLLKFCKIGKTCKEKPSSHHKGKKTTAKKKPEKK